jgi:7,8-dihydroneopterin aldolase/epimerase/oxygenase
MGLIEIEGMKFYAFHGHFESEQKVGNEFRVDLRIETNCDLAAISDNLNDALNYQTAYETVKKEMSVTSYLLENVAKRVLDSLYSNFESIIKAEIKISKMNPPMGGEIEKVSITMSR